MATPPNPYSDAPRLSPEAPSSFVLPPQREAPVWSGWDVAMLFVVAVLALLGASMVVFAVARQFPSIASVPLPELARNARVAVPAQGLGYIILLVFMYAMVSLRYGLPFWSALQWRFPSRRWPAFVLMGVGTAFLLQLFSSLLPIPKKLPIDELFRDAGSAYLLAAFGIVVAPLVEELFFRGFLYPVLARRFGLLIALVATALPFAVMHAGQLAVAWAPLLVLFLVGLILTAIRARTGSLAASVLAHAGYNGTLFVLIWIATDRFRHLERLAR